MSVGTNIKQRRYELGMTQQELADAMGYRTRSTIAKIESGENDVSQKKLQRLAQVLDTTVERLINGADRAVKSGGTYAVTADDAQPLPGSTRTAAFILAGGKSSRNRQNIPNQFLNILGKPVIVYALESYQRHPAVDDIYVICLSGWERIVTSYAEEYGITKLRGTIPAAATGLLSVRNGVQYAAEHYGDSDIIIFQESTRPMVSVDTVSKLLQACYEKGHANICESGRDHVHFMCTDRGAQYIDRNAIVDLQSPEAYRLSVIRSVFEEAERRQILLNESCCAMLLHRLGRDINFIEGGINNLKIIRQEDIAIFTALLRQREEW